MKNLSYLLLIIFTYGFFLPTALVQDKNAALVPLPSVDDFSRANDGWEVTIRLEC